MPPKFHWQPLPSKVVEWLARGKCLTQMVTPRDKAGEAVDVHISACSDQIIWTSRDGHHWTCQRECVGSASVFKAGKDGETLTELMSDGDIWMTMNEEYVMPGPVVTWLSRPLGDTGSQQICNAIAERRATMA